MPHMKQLWLFLALATVVLTPALPEKKGNPSAGRWDITVTTRNAAYPGWMEFTGKDGKPALRIQPRSGSVYPVKDFKLDGAKLTLIVNTASETRPATTWELNVKGDQFTGTIKRGDTVQGQLAGVRAPALNRKPPKAWTNPEPLFNGKDLTGWEPTDPAINHWVAKDGVLLNESKGANIKTTRKFDDFKLHIEFNCPEGGNSGVYLRGRYEIQVEYEAPGTEDQFHCMGAIYGFLAPAVELPRTASRPSTTRRFRESPAAPSTAMKGSPAPSISRAITPAG
jgi:hypothetical protein